MEDCKTKSLKHLIQLYSTIFYCRDQLVKKLAVES